MINDEKNVVDDSVSEMSDNGQFSDNSQNKDSSASSSPQSSEIQSLEEEITTLKTQNESTQDKLLRAVAEGENIRRRAEKNVEEARDYANANILKDLVAVMDNLTRALSHKPIETDEKLANVYSGIEMTKQELETIFKKHGLEIINPQIGEKFDYNLHEAVAQIATNDYDQDSVISIMQAGYKIKTRLLRAAMVTVSKKA